MAKRIKVEAEPAETDPPAKPLRSSAAKLCAFCKHMYLRPCTEKTNKACPNWQHLQKRRK